MNPRDIKVLSVTSLGDGVTLERVINQGGVPYSTISFEGREYLSNVTEKEDELLKHFERERDIYLNLWTKGEYGRTN